MKYKLSHEEILALYPLATPQRIETEFSRERSPSASSIYKLYARHGLIAPTKAYKVLLNELIEEIKLDNRRQSYKEIRAVAHKNLEKLYQERIQELWESIKNYEERYGDISG